MFLLDDGAVVYSASDLTVASSCEFGLLRRLDAKLGRVGPLELVEDAMRDRAARLGDRYEEQVLAELRDRFGPWERTARRGVAEIVRPGRGSYDRAGLTAKHAETLEVLRTGADVVFQAGFFDGRFSGWADFVIRDDDGVRYAVHDTKLARRAKVTALLQIAAYADQLLAEHIPVTEHVHLILGDRTTTEHRLDDLLPVYRERRVRLEQVLDEHLAETGPVQWGDARYTACGRCDVCAVEVKATRDVLVVAGVRATQRARLRAAGITTVDQLAADDREVTGIPATTLATVRAQARLQVAQDPPAPGAPPPPLPTGAGVSGGIWYHLFDPTVVGHLPVPDPGDVFFDFEGDPLWMQDGSTDWGLEYLFGLVEAPVEPGVAPVFRAFWAHDRDQERQALLDFLSYIGRRRAQYPGMHIYHYAAYEKTALLRLAGRHGVGEAEVDQLLRDGVLVDLYATVRACLRTGQRSYSLKKLEPLYMDAARSGDVQTAGESVVEYAEACAVRDAGDLDQWQARLDQIAEYNEYDCASTLGLRDWLLARAAEVRVHPRGRDAVPVDGTSARPTAEVTAADLPDGVSAADLPDGVSAADLPDDVVVPPEVDPLAERLAAAADLPLPEADRTALAMLGAALGYHWREIKPFWWAHFDRLVADPAEWTDRRTTFLVEQAEVTEDWARPPGKQTVRRTLRLTGRLDPGSALSSDTPVCLLYARPVPPGVSTSVNGRRGWTERAEVVAVEAIGTGDRARDVLTVVERSGRGQDGHPELPMAVTPGRPPPTTRIVAAIRALAATVADALPEPGHGEVPPGSAQDEAAGTGSTPTAVHLPDGPALDLLRRRPPRTRSGVLPAVVGTEYIAAITAAVADLDGSYLAVQGPPGTGKTYTGARVIAALVARGWRIGVVAQSHTVVENMLRAVAGAGVPVESIGKRPQDAADPDAPWLALPNEPAFARFHTTDREGTGYVIGGTTWDLTHPGRLPTEPLDLLVIDEAGQYALPDALAVSGAARSMLLLGDPQQLPQVTQGRHPQPVDCSALGWVAAGHEVLPPELGYFLARTWRMHPALTEVVSRLSYAGRLSAVDRTARRSLDGVQPGVACVLVRHEGNVVASAEEATEVVAQVRSLLGRRWVDPDEDPAGRPLDEDDVIVVAAYNAQVWTVRRALDEAGLTGVRVGTVDRYQGQEAVVALVTTAASSAADVPRGMEFLLSRNRVNVAMSRAQWLAIIVRSPELTHYLPGGPEHLAELGAFIGVCTT